MPFTPRLIMSWIAVTCVAASPAVVDSAMMTVRPFASASALAACPSAPKNGFDKLLLDDADRVATGGCATCRSRRRRGAAPTGAQGQRHGGHQRPH